MNICYFFVAFVTFYIAGLQKKSKTNRMLKATKNRKKNKIAHQPKPGNNEGVLADKINTVLQEKWVKIEVPGYDVPSSYRKSIWIVLKSPPARCLTR